jgi:hypothetical protein
MITICVDNNPLMRSFKSHPSDHIYWVYTFSVTIFLNISGLENREYGLRDPSR